MYELEIRVLSLNKGLGIPTLLERDGGCSLLALRRYKWRSRLELGPYMLGEGAPWIEALQVHYAGRSISPNPQAWGWERERRSRVDYP